MRIKSITKQISTIDVLFYIILSAGLGAYIYQGFINTLVFKELALLGITTLEHIRNCVMVSALFLIGCKIFAYGFDTDESIIQHTWYMGIDYIIIIGMLMGLFFSSILMGIALAYALVRLVTTIIPDYHYYYEDCPTAAAS